MKTSSSVLSLACVIAALEIAASAASVPLNPIADAFVSSNPAQNALSTAAIKDSNYGGAGALGAAAAGLAKGEFDSLLKFDLAGVKASFDTVYGVGQWTITGATLQLSATSPGSVIFNGFGLGSGSSNVNSAGLVSIEWMQNDAWVEGTGNPNGPSLAGITFSSLPSFRSAADEPLGTFSFGGGTSGNDVWSLSLGTSFLADSTAGNTVSLLLLPADGNVAYLANSRSAGASVRPVLTVTAVPEPGTLTFGLVAAFTFSIRRVRRRGAPPDPRRPYRRRD
ncbi:MAG: hypothetical protein WCF18_19935 [Chthoniobacteraceae bacterium]